MFIRASQLQSSQNTVLPILISVRLPDIFKKTRTCYPLPKFNFFEFLRSLIFTLWYILIQDNQWQSFQKSINYHSDFFNCPTYSLSGHALIHQQKNIYSCFWNPWYDYFDICLHQLYRMSDLNVCLFAFSAFDERSKLNEPYLRARFLNSLVFEFFVDQLIQQLYFY